MRDRAFFGVFECKKILCAWLPLLKLKSLSLWSKFEASEWPKLRQRFDAEAARVLPLETGFSAVPEVDAANLDSHFPKQTHFGTWVKKTNENSKDCF